MGISEESRELHVKIAVCHEGCDELLIFFSADGSQLMAAMGSTRRGEKDCFRVKLKSILLFWANFTIEVEEQL